tara:strand:- start:163 stop:435 length:273 start_codon:yes stop_codon:yes gene_type:complete
MIKESDVKTIIRNNTIYKISLGSVVFKDSYLLLPAPLDKLGLELLGTGKLEQNLNFTFKSIVEDKQDIIKYCYNDSDILFKCLNVFRGII